VGELSVGSRRERTVRRRLRAAGVTERGSGRGDCFSDSVLVWRHGIGKREVYDQGGELLATGSVPDGSSWTELFGICKTITYARADGRPLITVSPDRRRSPRRFRVTGDGIPGLGSVGRDLSIEHRGQEVGYLDRPWLPRMFRFRRPDFTLYEGDRQVGQIKQQRRFVSWTVIELDPDATVLLRGLLFGVEAVINAPRPVSGG